MLVGAQSKFLSVLGAYKATLPDDDVHVAEASEITEPEITEPSEASESTDVVSEEHEGES